MRVTAAVLAALVVVGSGATADAGQLRLTWMDNASDETAFVVERRAAGAEAFEEIARTGPDVDRFDDVLVESGTAYCYRVAALNAMGRSSPSNEACGVARPFAALPMLGLDLLSSPPGRGMIAIATLTPGDAPVAVDAYIVVALPDGSLVSMTGDGTAVPGVAPIASGLVPFPITFEIVRYAFTGTEPPGSYTWYAAITESGTLGVIGDVSVWTFEYAP